MGVLITMLIAVVVFSTAFLISLRQLSNMEEDRDKYRLMALRLKEDIRCLQHCVQVIKALRAEGKKSAEHMIESIARERPHPISMLMEDLDNYCESGNIQGVKDNPHWIPIQWHIHNDSKGYRICIGADGIGECITGPTLHEALLSFYRQNSRRV